MLAVSAQIQKVIHQIDAGGQEREGNKSGQGGGQRGPFIGRCQGHEDQDVLDPLMGAHGPQIRRPSRPARHRWIQMFRLDAKRVYSAAQTRVGTHGDGTSGLGPNRQIGPCIADIVKPLFPVVLDQERGFGPPAQAELIGAAMGLIKEPQMFCNGTDLALISRRDQDHPPPRCLGRADLFDDRGIQEQGLGIGQAVIC